MKKLKRWTGSVFLFCFCAPTLSGQESESLSVSNDTYIRDGLTHLVTGVSEFLDTRDGAKFVPYIQFDLSGLKIDTVLSATLTLHKVAGSRNDAINNVRFATYGLPDLPGNTLQFWQELEDFDPTDETNGLDFRNVGLDFNLDADSGVDRKLLTSLDPEDGTIGLVETVDNETGIIALTGETLVGFLNDRVDQDGLVTLIFPLENGGADRGYGIASKENPDSSLHPVLDLEFTNSGILLGDVNCDGVVNLLDVAPFVQLVSAGDFLDKADINQDGVVNLLDVSPFVEILSGG